MTLTPRERTIMALLAAGYTDVEVAEQLDLSVRTIAYIVRNLMDRYQVKNRFQLGLALGAEAVQDEAVQDKAVPPDEPDSGTPDQGKE